MKALARDREDWKTGRAIDLIKFVHYGDLTLELDTVVLGLGPDSLAVIDEESSGSSWSSQVAYSLCAILANDSCPSRPSGEDGSDVDCYVQLTVNCEAFIEDF